MVFEKLGVMQSPANILHSRCRAFHTVSFSNQLLRSSELEKRKDTEVGKKAQMVLEALEVTGTNSVRRNVLISKRHG